MYLKIRGVPIHQISKISAADMTKFAISKNSFTCTNNLMHCLIVAILCCVDHFTSFVAVLLLLAMFSSEFCRIICAVSIGKTACHAYRIDYQYQLLNKYQISGKHKNLISAHL